MEAAKGALRRRFGLWPLMELRTRALLGPAALGRGLVEIREVRRLRRRRQGPQPGAVVATIIPTYRRPELLEQAVRSALDQTFRDQVVMVVDDGGGDVDLRVSDPRLHVVSLSRNTGVVGVARNVGIKLTRSRYVAFLDDDNTWSDDHLELALAAHDSETSLTVSAIERVHVDGVPHDVVGQPFTRADLREDCRLVDSSAIVVRRGRDVHFSRIRRTRASPQMEDWELVYRLTKRRGHRFIPEPTVRYLINPMSSYTQWDKQLRSEDHTRNGE